MKRVKTVLLFLTTFTMILLIGGGNTALADGDSDTIVVFVDVNADGILEYTFKTDPKKGENATVIEADRNDTIVWQSNYQFAIYFKEGRSPIRVVTNTNIPVSCVDVGTINHEAGQTYKTITGKIPLAMPNGTYPYIVVVVKDANTLIIDDPEVKIPKP